MHPKYDVHLFEKDKCIQDTIIWYVYYIVYNKISTLYLKILKLFQLKPIQILCNNILRILKNIIR
jgi:hypothetical protein